MSWYSKALNSSLGRKVIMALSGGFLIIFLFGHISGNTLLFKDDGGEAFNIYARFMTTNPAVKILSYLTYGSIILHIVYSILLTMYNRNARKVGYAVAGGNASSSWNSRNMGILGSVILVFIVIHMYSFWYKMHFGDMPMTTIDGKDVKDLYTVVNASFHELWYVILYVVSMGVLTFHLSHGFSSAFQTLGLNHKKYTPIIEKVGMAIAVIVPVGFASMPVFMYLFR